MCSSIMLTAVLISPAAPIPHDSIPSENSPPPRILSLKADPNGNLRVIGTIPVKITITNTVFTVEQVVENGQQVMKQVQKQVEQDILSSQYLNKPLADFGGKFMTADGQELTLNEATNRIKNGATMLASTDGKPVAKLWLRAVKPDTVVMLAEGLEHVQPQWGGGMFPTTPAPRLTMLGTDENGKVVAPCTSSPINENGMGGEIFFDGRGAKRIMRGGIQFDGANQEPNAKVVYKPLADVKFDAYDVTGKLISRNTALKRFAAGGMAIIATDSQLPDERYLSQFHKDILVLVGPELILPQPFLDQTTKKEKKEGEAEQKENVPNQGRIPPRLPVKPGVIIQGGRGNIILPAVPAVEEAPKVAKPEK